MPAQTALRKGSLSSHAAPLLKIPAVGHWCAVGLELCTPHLAQLRHHLGLMLAPFPYRMVHVMSGYRTPFYNRAIGNVQYSRHVYGDAADIFVDASPRDELMDDLNRDGTVDLRDAKVLHEIVEGLDGGDAGGLVGGLAAYDATTAHGPFVHMDLRGYRARWGR